MSPHVYRSTLWVKPPVFYFYCISTEKRGGNFCVLFDFFKNFLLLRLSWIKRKHLLPIHLIIDQSMYDIFVSLTLPTPQALTVVKAEYFTPQDVSFTWGTTASCQVTLEAVALAGKQDWSTDARTGFSRHAKYKWSLQQLRPRGLENGASLCWMGTCLVPEPCFLKLWGSMLVKLLRAPPPDVCCTFGFCVGHLTHSLP